MFWENNSYNTSRKVDAINPMILGDRRISAEKIAQTLMLSQKTVGYIIHQILDMREL
jgi:hypothetical protein